MSMDTIVTDERLDGLVSPQVGRHPKVGFPLLALSCWRIRNFSIKHACSCTTHSMCRRVCLGSLHSCCRAHRTRPNKALS